MGRMKDSRLFELIRDFLSGFLPNTKGASEHTVRAYREALRQFLDWVCGAKRIALREVSADDFSKSNLLAYLDSLESEKGCSVSTRNHRLCCLRSFAAFASEEDMQYVPAMQQVLSVCLKAAPRERTVKHLSEEAVASLLALPDASSPKGRRDRALMAFLYDTGARVQEVVNMTTGDLRLGKSPAARLTGKGRKTRLVPLMDNTARLLRAYVGEMGGGKDAPADRPLFPSRIGDGGTHMTEDNIRKLMHKYGRRIADCCSEHGTALHPHMLRHSRAMHLYQNGMSLELLSQWLGHSHVETTLLYAHADTEMKRKAIESATPQGSNLARHMKRGRMTVDNEEKLRRLYALK